MKLPIVKRILGEERNLMKQQEDKIQNGIQEYNLTIEERASKQEEIGKLKIKLRKLESEYVELDRHAKKVENILQAEIYQRYTDRDLLKMVKVVEKYAKKEIVADFKSLVDKFEKHNLGVNDITQLQTYIKIYGKYVIEQNSGLRRIFKTLGGQM